MEIKQKDNGVKEMFYNMEIRSVTKEYSNGEVTVIWKSAKCTHSGICVKSLSKVFQPSEHPWIKMDNATTEEIVATVNKCPSGALIIKPAETR